MKEKLSIWLPMISTGTGAEVWTRRLAAGMEALGHHVVLDAVAHRFQYAPWLSRLTPPAGTDVIVANSWSASAFARPGIPLVSVVHHVVHGPELKGFKSVAQSAFHRFFVKPMEMRAIRKSVRLVAVSESTAADIRHYLADVPIDVVLNGVDTDVFVPPETRADREAGAPVRLLFVGKPSRRKGFDTVAAILDRLGERAAFTCIGGAPEANIARPAGRYLGRVSLEELVTEYQTADLLLFPSRLEGFGYAAAEALSCGLPVVCTKGSAVAEVTSPKSALVVPPEDVDGFVDGIEQIRQNPAFLSKMRTAARERAVSVLDEGRWLGEFETVLRAACEG